MKKLVVILLSVLILLATSFGESYARSSSHSTRVHGYTKKNGTHVSSYRRTKSDKSKFNNYSTKGNINPHTGKRGTKNPYKK